MKWLSGDRSPMASAIRRAADVPGAKRPAQQMTPAELSALYLDASGSFGVKDAAAFGMRAYEVLDSAVSAERRLDQAWRSADNENGRYGAAYYFLQYRLKFAQALARAEISRRMAAPDTASYCMQAMESAIDSLKSSAEARDRFDKLRESQGYGKVTDLPAATIREVRDSLLSAWHSSKSQGSLAPIREIDICETFNKALSKSVKDVKTRKEIGGLFRWMETSPPGNHRGPASVE